MPQVCSAFLLRGPLVVIVVIMGDDKNDGEYDGFIERGDCECVPFPRSKGREYVRSSERIQYTDCFSF